MTETNVGDLLTLEWDISTGSPPKKGEVIVNMFGERFRVVGRKRNEVTLKKLPPRK
jgi:hypothetical protein